MSRTHEECLVLLEQIRWGGIPTCPYCGSTKATAYKKEHRYHCNNCFTSYSVTVGTLFHKTHVNLHKWFLAIALVLRDKNDVTTRELAHIIGVNKNTASYMITRIHEALSTESDFLKKIMEWIGQSDR